MYNVNYTEILANGIKTADPSWPTKPCDKGWEFNHNEIPYTTIATEVLIYYKKYEFSTNKY